MNLMTNFNHIEDFGKLACQVLEMPYQGKDLSMVILLPHDNYGLAKLEKRLTHEKLQKAFESVTQDFHKVMVFMPRIKLTQQFLLNDILAKMGATDMFAPNADFSGITSGPEELSVSTVIHKAFVEINEKAIDSTNRANEKTEHSILPKIQKWQTFHLQWNNVILFYETFTYGSN